MSLVATAVSFSIGERRLIDEASLSLEPGRLHVLLGPNGAGKSTLLRLLAGDLKPAAGTVSLDGRALTDWPKPALARRRAVMMQREHLPFPFTVEQVVSLGRLPWQRADTHPEERAIVVQAIEEAGASKLSGRRYPELSGGERARVQLARAIAQIVSSKTDEPRYLMLDEPTASLDFAFQHHCLLTMRRLCTAGVGVLTILQDPNLALRYADVVSLINQGRIVAQGDPDSVLEPVRLGTIYGLPIDGFAGSDGRLAAVSARPASRSE